MKIDNLLRITGGVLRNTPSVDAIFDIKTNPKKILRGDLFLDQASSFEDVKRAQAQGAYAIISTCKHPIFDEEIAWIEVKDIELCLLKILRYLSTKKNCSFVALLSLQLAMLKSLGIASKFEILGKKSTQKLTQIFHAKEENTFLTKDFEYTQKIAPNTIHIPHTIDPEKLLPKGFFISSFTYKNRFIQDLKIPSLFVPYFCALLDFLETKEIPFKIENFQQMEHFYPQFVDKNFCKKDFGQSHRVLIFEYDLELYKEEINYLQEHQSHEGIVLFFPKDLPIQSTLKKVFFEKKEELLQYKGSSFRYIFIYGKRAEFEEFLNQPQLKQMQLF